MTRLELLTALIRQARSNGFEFRKWFTGFMRLPWSSFDQAVAAMLEDRRYYALLFSHDFAQSIWKPGSDITFVVPESFFRRVSPKDGTVIEVRRKPYTRRAGRRDVWKYHLQQLALSDEPLRYMRRYIVTTEHLTPNALHQDDEDIADFDEPLSIAAGAEESIAQAKPPSTVGRPPGRKRKLAL